MIVASESPIIAAFLAPHPPIIIPEIGKDSHEADQTVAALRQAAGDLARLAPDTLVIISPHAPLFSDYVYFYSGSRLSGTLAAFGCPEVSRSWPADMELADAIIAQLDVAQIPGGYLSDSAHTRHNLDHSLDHGVLVPLYYLAESLPNVRLVALSSSNLDSRQIFSLGEAIRRAAGLLGRRVVLIASGDLSHKVNRQSPYGSCPEGEQFDQQVMAAIKSSDLNQILAIDETIRDRAAECGYRSLIALCGAFNGIPVTTHVYYYEAPFGIGYGVAGFAPVKSADQPEQAGQSSQKEQREEKAGPSIPVEIARRTLALYLSERKRLDLSALQDLDLHPFDLQRAGVFVSLKKNGQLRGCIGTTGPTTENTVTEIIQNAISAATQDPRFDPIRAAELSELSISVDILGEAEPIASRHELDPKNYGVIVRRHGRTGLLLPDLEGVDTADDQVAIACRKAGIDRRLEDYSLERFRVTRYH